MLWLVLYRTPGLLEAGAEGFLLLFLIIRACGLFERTLRLLFEALRFLPDGAVLAHLALHVLLLLLGN